MTYFKDFPRIRYDYLQNGKPLSIVDITKRTGFLRSIVENATALVTYQIRDGETPQSIAHRVYDRADYHWLILVINNIMDPFFDWPLDSRSLEQYLEKTYKGQTVYYDPSQIKTGDGVTLSSYNVVPQIGDKLTLKSNSVSLGEVLASDLSLGSVRFSNTSVNVTNSDVLVGPNYEIPVQRSIDISYLGLSHFEDNDNNIVDPNTELVGLSFNTPIQAYRNNAVFPLQGVWGVSLQSVEESTNDRKRQIRVLRREYVDQAVKEFKDIMRNG